MSISPALALLASKAQFEGTIIFSMNPLGELDIFELDITTRRSHVDPGSVVSFPVGQGSKGADMINRDSGMLTVEGLLTNTPINYFGIGGGLRPNRVIELYQKLIEIYEREDHVFVFTDVRAWYDMVIESVMADEDAESGESLPIVITLKQAPILETATLPAKFDLDVLLLGGGGTIDFGTQAGSFDYQPPEIVDTFDPFV